MKFKIKIQIVLLFIAFTALMSAMPAKAQLLLTKEEQDYINSRGTIKAASVDGVAPIQYFDSKGRVKGISINVLDTISGITGLKFTYELYKTTDEVKSSDADIIFGVPEKNQFERALSIPI